MTTQKIDPEPTKRTRTNPAILPVVMLCVLGTLASPMKAAADTGDVADNEVRGDQDAAPAYPAQAAPPVVQRLDEDRQPETATARTRTKWYGWQILVADGVGLMTGSLVSFASNQAAPAVLGWTLSGSVVHAFHRRPESAAASILLRVGLPVVGAYVGYKIDYTGESDTYLDFDGLAGLLLGGVVGMVSATVIDATVLARYTEDQPNARPSPHTQALSLPVVGVGRNGDVSVGWRGTF